MPKDFAGTWKDCNLYDNHFSEDMAEIAFTGRVRQRQAERIIAALKVKAGLKRRGAKKNGEWYFG